MSLIIEHNGHELYFREDDESWSCSKLSLKASSLRALKAKISKVEGVARKVSVPVFIIGHRDSVENGTITMIAKRKDWNKDYSANRANFGRPQKTLPAVWVNKVSGNQMERKKVTLSDCVEPTPEVLAILESTKEMFAKADAIEREAKQMINNLPRMTLEDLEQRGAEEDPADEEKDEA